MLFPTVISCPLNWYAHALQHLHNMQSFDKLEIFISKQNLAGQTLNVHPLSRSYVELLTKMSNKWFGVIIFATWLGIWMSLLRECEYEKS